MKDCRNEYALGLIQQMSNLLVLHMSSRTLRILLWPFLFTSVLFNSWRMTSLNTLVFNDEFCSARLYRIPHSCSRVFRLSAIHVHWRIFTLGEYLHCHAEKMPNNAGNEGRVASSVSSSCFPSHSSVWIHDSIDKAQLPHTFSTYSSLYKSSTTSEHHCGPRTSHCTPPLATPEHRGCFCIRNVWLGLLRPDYGLPEVSIL